MVSVLHHGCLCHLHVSNAETDQKHRHAAHTETDYYGCQRKTVNANQSNSIFFRYTRRLTDPYRSDVTHKYTLMHAHTHAHTHVLTHSHTHTHKHSHTHTHNACSQLSRYSAVTRRCQWLVGRILMLDKMAQGLCPQYITDRLPLVVTALINSYYRRRLLHMSLHAKLNVLVEIRIYIYNLPHCWILLRLVKNRVHFQKLRSLNVNAAVLRTFYRSCTESVLTLSFLGWLWGLNVKSKKCPE